MRARPVLALLLAAPLAACATYGTGHDEDEAMTDEPAQACPQTRNWTAWVNAMPGPGAVPTLIVTGEADVPEGMTVSLREGPLDRMMPPAQRFVLTMTAGEGASGWQPVRASIAPAQTAYRAVIIGCDGQEIARIDQVQTAY